MLPLWEECCLAKITIKSVLGPGYELPNSKVMQIRSDASEFAAIKKAICDVAGCTENVDEVM